MHKKILKGTLSVLAVLLVATSVVFVAAFSGLLSPEDAVVIAQQTVEGDIGEVELEEAVYEVDVVTGDTETEVQIDATTGDVLSVTEEPTDVEITGDPLELASAAALAYIGEGRVTDTEVGDEEGFYEIEVTLDNGNEVDVHLDEQYNVLSVER